MIRLKSGSGLARHLRPFGGLIDGPRRSLFQLPRQIGNQAFGLADHHVVRLEFGRRHAAGNGPAHHGAQPARPATLHNG